MNRPELAEGDVLTRRYLLQERIATGGMSVIWKAFDQSLQRTVAIKLLDSSLDGDNPGRELIRREARATARLIHPDAIEVYDYGETVTPRGRLAAYVVMRLLEGRSLADRLAEGPLPWEEAAATAARLALVLAAAHERGIVHRDVTPENVLLTPEGAKLLDFGIAAFAGEADDELVKDFGTPPYVAPERLRELPAAPAVDVYSLGVLLYEMLKGRPPYPETTWEGIEQARRDGPPPVPDGVPGLPSEIAALCRRCLSPDPTERPSAREVAAALMPGEAEREPGWVKWGAAVAGVLALGILLVQQPGTPAGLAADISLSATPTSQATARTPADHSVPVMDPAPETAEPRATDAGSPPIAEDEPEPPPKSPPPRPTPRPGSTLGPIPLASPAPGVPTVKAAAAEFDRLVAEGDKSGHIIGYAADDLRLELRNMIANDDANAIGNLRRKLDDRLREEVLTPAFKSRLERALDRLSAAFAAKGT